MKTGLIISGVLLAIFATVPAVYAAWLWLGAASWGIFTPGFWDLWIPPVILSGILYAVAGVLLWRGRNDWLD